MTTRVTTQDLRAAKICFGGVRPWFRRHALDWSAFVAGGIRPSGSRRPATRWRSG